MNFILVILVNHLSIFYQPYQPSIDHFDHLLIVSIIYWPYLTPPLHTGISRIGKKPLHTDRHVTCRFHYPITNMGTHANIVHWGKAVVSRVGPVAEEPYKNKFKRWQ